MVKRYHRSGNPFPTQWEPVTTSRVVLPHAYGNVEMKFCGKHFVVSWRILIFAAAFRAALPHAGARHTGILNYVFNSEGSKFKIVRPDNSVNLRKRDAPHCRHTLSFHFTEMGKIFGRTLPELRNEARKVVRFLYVPHYFILLTLDFTKRPTNHAYKSNRGALCSCALWHP